MPGAGLFIGGFRRALSILERVPQQGWFIAVTTGVARS